MSILQKDIFVGVLFIGGILGYMSGEFMLSTIIFATATLFSSSFR